MYSLTCSDTYQYPDSDDTPYVLDIFPIGSGLAATSSDSLLSLFDPLRLASGPVMRTSTRHGTLTAARPYDGTESVVATAGEDGHVALWDLRQAATAPALELQGTAALLSVACNAGSHAVVAGTELANHQASILIWDTRSGSDPPIQFKEVHSDDVTELRFSPIEPHILLTGSTDGLVNVLDLRIQDEDEVVIQAFNHGSVHLAGFVSSTEIYAASHDEKVALYDVAQERENGAAILDFGDIRPVLNCQYVSDILPKADGVVVLGVGMQDQEMFQLVHLSKGPVWTLDKESVVGLPGAHGSELVRTFRVFDEQQLVMTGGEDGCIKAWKPTG